MRLKIRNPRPQWIQPARSLYERTFPPQERRKWDTILFEPGMIARGPYLHILLTDVGAQDVFVGFLTTWHFDSFTYVEHFAVGEAFRGLGIGATVLKALIARDGCPVVVEVERPDENAPETLRRIAFYQRNGFEIIDKDYVQPPYADGMPSVPMMLMSSSPVSSRDVVSTLRREVYQAS